MPSPKPGRYIISRSRPPGRPSQVATSILCRDFLSAQSKKIRLRHQNGVATPISNRPSRDLTMGSRHQWPVFLCDAKNRSPAQPGHDLKQAYPGRDLKTGSRHQNFPKSRAHVATSKTRRDTLTAIPGRYLKSKLRPTSVSPIETPLSRPKTLVRMPNLMLPIQPGRDVHFWSQPQVTRPCRDLKVMSRPQIVFPRSQHEFNVTTKDSLVLTSARSRARCPGRGRALALSCVQPPLPCALGPLLVTTLKLGRDLVLEIGSSHSSFFLTIYFFFKFL